MSITDQKVIGGGFMFLASGCGPALPEAERAKLAEMKPGEFYPLSDLLTILKNAEEQEPKLIEATGRRWGNAVKSEIEKTGATSVLESMKVLCQMYQDHHQGNVGKILVEEISPTSAQLTNNGLYPHALIFGAFEALVSAITADEVSIDITEQPDCCTISWLKED